MMLHTFRLHQNSDKIKLERSKTRRYFAKNIYIFINCKNKSINIYGELLCHLIAHTSQELAETLNSIHTVSQPIVLNMHLG